MGLIESSALARDLTFRAKIKIAMMRAAMDVTKEAEKKTPKYTKRQQFAVMILNSPDARIDSFAYGVASQTDIDANSSDALIVTAVNSLFDSLAGVKPSDAIEKPEKASEQESKIPNPNAKNEPAIES